MKKCSCLRKGCLGVISVLIVFCLSNCADPIESTSSANVESKGLVELYISSQVAPLKTSFPSEKMEAVNPTISCICYDRIYENSSYSSYTPYPYGYMHYEKIESCMNIERGGVPRTVFQRQSSVGGLPSDDEGMNMDLWIEDVQWGMKDKVVEKKIKITSFQLSSNDEGLYQATVSLQWNETMTQEELAGLRYNLFLKADRLYYYEYGDDSTFVENLAYDFIPLTGDTVEDYNGVGFPLFNTAENYPSEVNHFTLTLTTEFFTLPLIENRTSDQQPHWSLHFILNNNENVCKNLYSWCYPVTVKE